MKLSLLISFVLFFCFTLYSQVDSAMQCGIDSIYIPSTSSINCPKSSSSYQDYYSHKESFIPDNDTIPIKTLHVNLNIWQRADSTGNFRNDPTTITRLKNIFNNGMYFFENPYPIDLDDTLTYTVPTLEDTRFRVVLDSIYFYQDTTPDSMYYSGTNIYYDSCDGQLVQQGWPSTSNLQNYLETNHPERMRAYNYHITGGRWCGVGGFANWDAAQSFYKRTPPAADSTTHDWWYQNHFIHEIGHALDQQHRYQVNNQNCNPNNFDFLWDVYDTTQTSCPSGCDVCIMESGDISANIMGGMTARHISSLQAGVIHRAASTSNHNFSPTSWGSGKRMRNHVTGYSDIPFEITRDETWDFESKFFQDIVIKSGNTLIIKCVVEFVPQAKIIVEPGAKLIIDGGKLTNEWYYQDFWQGIEVHGIDSLVQNSSNSGMVKLTNGAIIEHAYNGIRTIAEVNGNLDWSKTGGIIECDDATFLNCRRGIEFMSYHNTNSSGVESNNASYISKGKFIVDSELPNGVNPAVGISMFDVTGVTIKNCLFENQRTDLSSIDITERGSGIFSIDASYNVESGYALGTGNPVPGSENKFSNLFYGVMTTGGTSISKVRVMDNRFTNCAYGVGLHGCNYGVIGRNKFDMPGADYSFQDPYTGNWYNYGMGVYSIGSYGFNIEANKFSSHMAQTNYNDLGVYSDNSSHISSGKIYRNYFNNVTLGAQTTNNNLLLSYNCNDHTKGSISTFDLHAAGGDLADQGISFGNGLGVKNTANSCNNQTLHQVYKGLSNDFFYFYETGSLSTSCHNLGGLAQANSTPNECENTLRNRFTTSVTTTVENLEASLIKIKDSISSLEAQLKTAKGREKDTLESAIRVYNNYRLNTINDVVTTYLDTMWIDSAATFLKNEGSIEAMMMAVNIQMQRDTAEVMTYLDAIRDSADHYASLGDDPRVPEMRAFCNYQEFLLPIVNRTGSYYSLTADEKDTITAYADSSVAVSANARAIEYFLDEKQPVVQGADLPELERWAIPENTNHAIFEDITLTAVPNPTHGEVEFIISGINTEKCEVSVTDMQGRIIGTAVVNDGIASFEFTLHPSGVYFGKLLKNGELVCTIKVMNAH